MPVKAGRPSSNFPPIPDGIGTPDSASGTSPSQPPARPEAFAHPKLSRLRNPRLQEITAQSSDKKKRRAVKAIAADYEELQFAGISSADSAAIKANRDLHIATLSSIQTRLAQLIDTGLTDEAPPFSLSRSIKNGLALNASLNAYLRAAAYASRPRLPTAVIATTTANRIAEELAGFSGPTSTQRIRGFNDAQRAVSGASAATPTADLQAAAAAGTSAPAQEPAQISRWHFSETENNAIAFNTFQVCITATVEYQNVQSKPWLVHRVDTLVDAMRASPALRATCFAIAAESMESCEDRVAVILNDMEQALISEKAESGKLTTLQVYAKGVEAFKKQILDEIALDKINDLKSRGRPVDEIDVRLAFPTALRDRLALNDVADSMHYRESKNITPQEIDSAEKTVRQNLTEGKGIVFLTQWRPWRKAMEKAHPEAFRALRDGIQTQRDLISTMPRNTIEKTWRDALARQQVDEQKQIGALVKRVTHRFIADHYLETA